MATPAKKPRTEKKNKSFFSKQARTSHRKHLEVGDKGFLITCNFKEKDSIHECYRLLNEYHKKNEQLPSVETNEDDDDIASQLENQIEKTKQEVKDKAQLFQSIDTGVQNCIFIKASIDDPLELGTRIIRDLADSQVKKTKVTLRFLPIETTCRAKLDDIKNAAGQLFDKHFLKTPSTFGINFNRRFNSDVNRDEVIKELAEMVSMKNPLNKVNLKEPEKSIVVEVMKGLCMLSVIPNYNKYKKYNVNELWARREKEEDEKSSQEKDDESKLSSQEGKEEKPEAEVE